MLLQSLLSRRISTSSDVERDLESDLRHELQPYGVTVVEVLPGSFRTGLQILQSTLKSFDTVWHRASQEMRDEFGSNYNDEAKAFLTKMQSKLLANDFTWVVDAYFESIVVNRPKLLHRVGWDALFKFYPYSLLPVRLQLIVMKLLMNAAGAPLPSILWKNGSPANFKEKSF
uniref:Exocyst subunit Exo70 family protein n=1 Tax=Setaria digitata TaxID=48799 RepID=A0A915PL84_9BILA